ncbi:MAG TPA: hypothetical protein PLO16_09960 [Acidocella sp.]|nr:hypothetical protein [Acidocella sp.]
MRADHVVINGAVLPTRTILWAAGVAASPAARWLRVKSDRIGRVIVDAQLHPENGRGAAVVDFGRVRRAGFFA